MVEYPARVYKISCRGLELNAAWKNSFSLRPFNCFRLYVRPEPLAPETRMPIAAISLTENEANPSLFRGRGGLFPQAITLQISKYHHF